MTAAIARKANRPPVYLDYQATTPVDPRVLQAMLPWFTEKFGNPASITHAYGREAEAAVEKARGQLASLIKADAREIVFTSGATEANNMAVKGALRFHKQFGKDRIVTLVTEHKCVLESAIRISLGWSTSAEDIDQLAAAWGALYARGRASAA